MALRSGRVVVVGSMNVDHVARVDHLPPPGATILADGYRTAPGGKGLNQAVSAARQGAPTVMIAAVGDDRAGTALLDVLDTEGIDRSRVRVVGAAPTGVALITVATDGANVIVVAAGANATVEPSQLQGFDWATGDVALCQLEIPVATVEAALRGARGAGATTLLNPAPAAGPLPASLLALVDVLVPNEGEAATLASLPDDTSPFDAGRALASQVPGAVIVTVGAEGSLVFGGSEVVGSEVGGGEVGGGEVGGSEGSGGEGGVVEIPAHRVAVADTTAAGDSYCGALAAALAGGADLAVALRRASAAGSLATTRHGAVPSIPTRAEVDALLGGADAEARV